MEPDYLPPGFLGLWSLVVGGAALIGQVRGALEDAEGSVRGALRSLSWSQTATLLFGLVFTGIGLSQILFQTAFVVRNRAAVPIQYVYAPAEVSQSVPHLRPSGLQPGAARRVTTFWVRNREELDDEMDIRLEAWSADGSVRFCTVQTLPAFSFAPVATIDVSPGQSPCGEEPGEPVAQ
jgi:hypothetical protein